MAVAGGGGSGGDDGAAAAPASPAAGMSAAQISPPSPLPSAGAVAGPNLLKGNVAQTEDVGGINVCVYGETQNQGFSVSSKAFL